MQNSSCSQCCSLNKLLVLVLMGGFVMLMMDIRLEHVDVAKKDWKPWIPIIYSGAMIFMSMACLALWSKGGRQLLLVLYSLALVVGLLGVWFHNGGHPINGIMHVLSAWSSSFKPADDMPPPAIAPLAFCGLGFIGILATLKPFQPKSTTTPQA